MLTARPTLRSLAATLSVALLAPACLLTSEVDSGALQACSNGADVSDAARITAEYGDSLHEMVACGGLAVALCNGVASGIVNAIITSSNDATPDGWTFETGGTYRTSGEGVMMTTQFFTAEDFDFAAAGELVTDNVFLVENYVVGAQVNVNLSNGRTTLSFDSTGPLVALLGYGTEPTSPIELTLSDIGEIEDRLAALEFEAKVVVDDVREFGTIQYDTETPRLPVKSLLTGSGMRYDLIKADGTRADLSQALVVDAWDIEFVDEGGGALNGKSEFRVVGGEFDYQGVTTFDNSTLPETELSCP